jgi:hypothetical protein
MGSYGYCVGPRDYDGDLQPRLHPRRLLDGVIEGVRDGGNKSGIPTPFGQVMFHPGYLGKCLVFVTALGIMPAEINGEPSDQKTILPGDLAIMCGGRVGKDGIHGVTASSATFSKNTPAGHVQIGDPYTQKKMHDFLLDARDEGLIRFITDNGGGGLSSSIGESALFPTAATSSWKSAVEIRRPGPMGDLDLRIPGAHDRGHRSGPPGAFHGAFPAACRREHRDRHLHRQRQNPHHLQRCHLCLRRPGSAHIGLSPMGIRSRLAAAGPARPEEPVLGLPKDFAG